MTRELTETDLDRLRWLAVRIVGPTTMMGGMFVAFYSRDISSIHRKTIATPEEIMTAIRLRVELLETGNDYLRARIKGLEAEIEAARKLVSPTQ